MKIRKRDVITGDGSEGYLATKVCDPDKYRMGALYLGYKNYRIGAISERIRDFFQNKLAHGDGEIFPIFKLMNRDMNFYGGFFTKKTYIQHGKNWNIFKYGYNTFWLCPQT